MSALVEVTPSGRFALGESIRFGFGQRDSREASVMRLGFVLDGYSEQVGVAVEQDPSGTLSLTVTGSDDLTSVARHVARVLSVDVDGTAWDGLGGKDPLIGRLQAARPGLRPPLFYSAYEALAWAVLSARRPREQMTALRDRLAGAHGATIEVAGESMAVLPSPRQLLAVTEFPGLPEVKLRRLHGVAEAALDGRLDTEELRALPPAEASTRLQALEGIGPFYADLVVVRALGHTDVLPQDEPQARQLAGRLTGALQPLTTDEYADLAAGWTPWRTWATVAIRAAGPLLLDGPVKTKA
jgi:DNA-3-methyladenine glycosylase II